MTIDIYLTYHIQRTITLTFVSFSIRKTIFNRDTMIYQQKYLFNQSIKSESTSKNPSKGLWKWFFKSVKLYFKSSTLF